MDSQFDLVILGSGSTAFAAALTAEEMGKSAVMGDERPIGGTCVNRGCLPSKNLIAAAKILHEARNPRYPGLMPCEIGLDFPALVAQKEEVLIATGSRPVLPDIDGLDRVPYLPSALLTVDEPMELRELPRSLLIVGGGYIALELGQMFSRFGTVVTIIERSPQLLAHGYEPEVGRSV